LAWTPRQREILTLLRDEAEVFFWEFTSWKQDGRLLHSLEVLEGQGVIKPGKTVKPATAKQQSLPSTGSWVLTATGKSAAAKLP
jgi:hypothetical protein